MTIDPELQAEIEAAIAAKRAAGETIDPHQLSIDMTSKWEEPAGRGSSNWLYQMRDTLRQGIEAFLAAGR